jgi:hypothetical protein
MFPDESQQIVTSIVPSPGQSVTAEAAYVPLAGTTLFELCDNSENVCTLDVQTSPLPPAGTAEWIVERTQFDGMYPFLADYQSETFNGGQACRIGGCFSIGQLSDLEQITMTTCNGNTVMSQPGPLNSTGDFTTTWESYGDDETVATCLAQ